MTIICKIRYNRYVAWAEFGLACAEQKIHRVDFRIDLSEGGIKVSEVRVKDNESLDSALRRFKRQCAKSGVMSEIRKREHYEKPSVKRKKKSEAARKRKF